MVLGNRFCDAYGVVHPIASAGMAFVASTPDLAIAVAKAGGLAAIGAGILPPDGIRHCVAAFRSAIQAKLNLNLLAFMTNDDTIDLCIDVGTDIVSFHWGHPSRAWIERFHAARIKVWEQVGSTAAAALAVQDGIDLVIIQGSEAGGHNYGELPLANALVDARKVLGPQPLLLAAGGIVDGAGLAAAIALGADGAMIGSRLVASIEADAHADYKSAIVAHDGRETVLTSIFGRDMPHFNPMRVIANGIVRKWVGRESELPMPDAAAAPIATVQVGPHAVPAPRFSSFVPTRDSVCDVDDMPLLAGSGIGAIHSVESVAQIITRMAADARTLQKS